jgi:hypothetical protein
MRRRGGTVPEKLPSVWIVVRAVEEELCAIAPEPETVDKVTLRYHHAPELAHELNRLVQIGLHHRKKEVRRSKPEVKNEGKKQVAV